MYATSPKKITNDLVGQANHLLSNWRPSDFAIKKLRRDAEKLRGVSAQDYDMILGLCAAMRGDLDQMRQVFQRAIMKSGGDDDIIQNYSRSLALWHLYGEAADALVKYANSYKDSIEYSAEVVEKLVRAGRFHEAATYYKHLLILAPAANDYIEEWSFVPALSEALSDLTDEMVAPAVEHFGFYLREIKEVKVEVTWDILHPEETDQEFSGVEIIYFIDKDPAATAALDYEGSKFLGEVEYEAERSGRLIFSIRSSEADADQAA